MKIEFVGGARTVTGSSYIIKDKDYTIMVDCGMFQGKRELRDRNALDLIYAPKKIDALILTHAHIDHSGLIPKLVKDGFFGKIYATNATSDLCSVMLPDSAHIQEMDVKWINKKNRRLGRPEIDPLYNLEDAAKSLDCFVPVDYGETVEIHPKIRVCFRDAGHILGSSFVEMWIKDDSGKETKLVFSGDLGPKNQAIIRDPEVIDYADMLFIESTYGNRLHKSREDTYSEFKQIILDSYNKNGNIIIPAFAVERTQEIIYTLGKLFSNNEIPQIPVYIDSPLAINATEIFRKNAQCFDKETKGILMSGSSPLDFPNLYFTRTTEESKQLNDGTKGAIIISASGMCTAGRIKFHLQNNLYRAASSVVFVGYQAEGTLGRRLVEGADQVKVYGENVVVRSRVYTLGGFSGHADRDGLLDWMGHIKNPNLKVFVVHGEKESSLSLAENIRSEFGYTSYVPHWGEIIDVSTMESKIASYGRTENYSAVDTEIESLQYAMKNLLSRYQVAKKENSSVEMQRLKDDLNEVKQMISIITDDL